MAVSLEGNGSQEGWLEKANLGSTYMGAVASEEGWELGEIFALFVS